MTTDPHDPAGVEGTDVTDEPTTAPGSSAADGAGVADGADRARSAASSFRLVLLGVLVVALLAAAGALVWLLAGRRGEADDLQRQREAVMDASRQFMLQTNSYGPDDLDKQGHLEDYQASVSDLLTPKFQASFDKSVQLAEQVAASGVTRSAQVFGVGVDTLDGDKATALVAGAIDTSYTPQGKKKPVSQEDLFRVEVQLVESDGDWRVDDFSPVNGNQQ